MQSLLPDPDAPVIWRGPKKQTVLRQFVTNVNWATDDIVLIDTPPGTSDEHLALLTILTEDSSPLNLLGALLVTTPQAVAASDVQREIDFCRTTKLEMLGLVENMAGFVCPCCGEVTHIFAAGGGAALAKQAGIPLLASVPLVPGGVDPVADATAAAAAATSMEVDDGSSATSTGTTSAARAAAQTPIDDLARHLVSLTTAGRSQH
jgi:Mrp family chromosome partitioning ATPase